MRKKNNIVRLIVLALVAYFIMAFALYVTSDDGISDKYLLSNGVFLILLIIVFGLYKWRTHKSG